MATRIIIIYIILISALHAQFFEVNLSHEFNNLTIKDENRYILENFNNRIIDYFKFNKFTTEHDYLDIPLHINIIYHKINFIDENTYNGIECQILISNNKDQYFITKNITLPYYKGRDIYYNSMQFDAIASILDFYAYIFIANELDTYGKYLGEKYYNIAFDLSNRGIESANTKQWEINKKLIEFIKENNNLRNIKFYFFKVIDEIVKKEKTNLSVMKESLKLILDNFRSVFEKYGYEKHTLKFLHAYNLELADLFDMFQIDGGINFLIKFDYKNKNIYEKFLNE